MKFNPEIHHRKTIRLRNYDYSQKGIYFVTICCRNKESLFGKIINELMIFNDMGKIADQYWQEIPQHYPNVYLDEYIIMPNHIHGILIIEQQAVGANDHSPYDHFPKKLSLSQHCWANNYPPLRYGTSKTIGAIIRGYKIGVTKWFRKNTNNYLVWQRNYYEHIIRNEKSLEQIRRYIINNPFNWQYDELNYEQFSPLQIR
jgi:putative transposase